MFEGHPCADMYPGEYFPHGITNGAQWYNVPGKTMAPFIRESAKPILSAIACGIPIHSRWFCILEVKKTLFLTNKIEIQQELY